jgi:PIN domain nuclease of toxin-antitoxin system
MILLDTFTLIGIAAEPDRLSPAARSFVEDSANRLFVSAISAQEIGVAVQKQRLILKANPRDWFEMAISHYNVEVIDVTWRIAMASVELPRLHSDPADRIIIATAMTHNLMLLTPDRKIHRYRQARIVW